MSIPAIKKLINLSGIIKNTLASISYTPDFWNEEQQKLCSQFDDLYKIYQEENTGDLVNVDQDHSNFNQNH